MRIRNIQIKDWFINQYVENLQIEYINNIRLSIEKNLVCSLKRGIDNDPTRFFKTNTTKEINITNVTNGVSALGGIPIGLDLTIFGFGIQVPSNSTEVTLSSTPPIVPNWQASGWKVGFVLTANVGGSLIGRRIESFDSVNPSIAYVESPFSTVSSIGLSDSFYDGGRAPNTWYSLYLIVNPSLIESHPDKYGFILIPSDSQVTNFYQINYTDIRFLGSIFLNEFQNIKPFKIDMIGNMQEVSWSIQMEPNRRLISSGITNPSTNIPDLKSWCSPNSNKVLLGYDISGSGFFGNETLNIGTNPGFIQRSIESSSGISKNYGESWFNTDDDGNIQFSNTGGSINIWAHGYREMI